MTLLKYLREKFLNLFSIEGEGRRVVITGSAFKKSLTDPTNQTEEEARFWEKVEREKRMPD